mgnify:CR=1 FL=1|tara:strand:+ start:207 stop:779 length:573 start_codon:yes stop_codon:yes gene_type:complete
MKKLLGIVVLGLLWCNVGFAAVSPIGKKLYCYAYDDYLETKIHIGIEFYRKTAKFSYMTETKDEGEWYVFPDTRLEPRHHFLNKTFKIYVNKNDYSSRKKEYGESTITRFLTGKEHEILFDTQSHGSPLDRGAILDRQTLVLDLFQSWTDKKPICEIVDYDPSEKINAIWLERVKEQNGRKQKEKKKNKI